MKPVVKKNSPKGLKTGERFAPYSIKISILEPSEIPGFTRCKVSSTRSGVGVVTIWIPQAMEHWAPHNFSEYHSPVWKYVMLGYFRSYEFNWSNFLRLHTWATRFNSQIPHLQYLEGFKTSFSLECHTSPKKLLKLSPLNIRSLQGKDLLDSSLSRVFSKFPAFTQLISQNLSHTCPLCDHQGISRPNSRARHFGKGNKFSAFKPIRNLSHYRLPRNGHEKSLNGKGCNSGKTNFQLHHVQGQGHGIGEGLARRFARMTSWAKRFELEIRLSWFFQCQGSHPAPTGITMTHI